VEEAGLSLRLGARFTAEASIVCGGNSGDHWGHPRRYHHQLVWQVRRPGNRDNIPIWLTIICGIGGVLIGWFIYTAFGGNGSPGIDWVRWIIAIVVAAVLVMIAAALTARSRSRVL